MKLNWAQIAGGALAGGLAAWAWDRSQRTAPAGQLLANSGQFFPRAGAWVALDGGCHTCPPRPPRIDPPLSSVLPSIGLPVGFKLPDVPWGGPPSGSTTRGDGPSDGSGPAPGPVGWDPSLVLPIVTRTKAPEGAPSPQITPPAVFASPSLQMAPPSAFAPSGPQITPPAVFAPQLTGTPVGALPSPSLQITPPAVFASPAPQLTGTPNYAMPSSDRSSIGGLPLSGQRQLIVPVAKNLAATPVQAMPTPDRSAIVAGPTSTSDPRINVPITAPPKLIVPLTPVQDQRMAFNTALVPSLTSFKAPV